MRHDLLVGPRHGKVSAKIQQLLNTLKVRKLSLDISVTNNKNNSYNIQKN